jgi:hypothetical protein
MTSRVNRAELRNGEKRFIDKTFLASAEFLALPTVLVSVRCCGEGTVRKQQSIGNAAFGMYPLLTRASTMPLYSQKKNHTQSEPKRKRPANECKLKCGDRIKADGVREGGPRREAGGKTSQ